MEGTGGGRVEIVEASLSRSRCGVAVCDTRLLLCGCGGIVVERWSVVSYSWSFDAASLLLTSWRREATRKSRTEETRNRAP